MNTERYISSGKCVICSGFIEVIQDRGEEVGDDEHHFKNKEDPADYLKRLAKEVVLLHIRYDVTDPGLDRTGHRKEIDRSIDESQLDQAIIIKKAPAQIGYIINQHIEKIASILMKRRNDVIILFISQYVEVNDQMDDQGQKAYAGIVH